MCCLYCHFHVILYENTTSLPSLRSCITSGNKKFLRPREIPRCREPSRPFDGDVMVTIPEPLHPVTPSYTRICYPALYKSSVRRLHRRVYSQILRSVESLPESQPENCSLLRQLIMPGHTVVTVEPVKESFYCPHCRLLLRDAVQNEEGFRLCQDCCDIIKRFATSHSYKQLVYYIIFLFLDQLECMASQQQAN